MKSKIIGVLVLALVVTIASADPAKVYGAKESERAESFYRTIEVY